MASETYFKPVTSFRDLAQFGVNGLTGESCAYGMRTLCDVNEEGKALFADFFSIPFSTFVLGPNWNSTVGEKPAVGSIMLVHDMVPKLAQFAFFRKGAIAVVYEGKSVLGVFDQDRLKEYVKYTEKYPNSGHSIQMNYAQSSSAPMAGSRNVHAMTGRAE